MRPRPSRAEVDSSSPRGWATCQRCGFQLNLFKLQWQFQWAGSKLQNLRLLVCDKCLDTPQRQLGTFVLPPDPVPIMNARPENYTIDEDGPAQTTISIAANAGTTSLVVASTDDFATGDPVIVACAAGVLARFIGTVNSTTSLAINGPLPYAAAVGNYVTLAD